MPWTNNLFQELKRLRTRQTWTESRPVYVATGLIAIAAVLMLAIVSGSRQPAVPVPIAPQSRQEAPSATAIRPDTSPAKMADMRAADKPLTGAAAEQAASAGKLGDKPRRPVTGAVSVAFGWHPHPLYGDWRYHPGVDVSASVSASVRAMWSGQVAEIYEDRQYGRTVAVTGGGYTVHYGSLDTVVVARDQHVSAGAIIGTVGEAPGERYPHLHLAVKSGGNYVDPQELLAKGE